MTKIAGRVALITGAGGGIGRQLAVELARRGARLVLWDIDADALETTRRAVRAVGGLQALCHLCDLGDRAAVQETARRVLEEVGSLDILIHNAGVLSGQRLLDLTDEQIERTFQVNTLALFWVTRAFLPAMRKQQAGHIVTISSASGLVGVAQLSDYAASKHAANGFAESLRVELARDAPGIATTLVCPYYVATGLVSGVRTRFPFLLPILSAEEVAHRVATAIERNERQVCMPPLVRLLPVARLLPVRVFDVLMNLLGVNVSMEGFDPYAPKSGSATR